MGRDKLRAFIERQKAAEQATTARARELIAIGEYDAAEDLVRAADQSIQGSVTLARLYKERLEDMVAAGTASRDRVGVEEVFRHARAWAWQAYPEPHTAMEADDYRAGRGEDLGRLVKVLGYEPAT